MAFHFLDLSEFSKLNCYNDGIATNLIFTAIFKTLHLNAVVVGFERIQVSCLFQGKISRVFCFGYSTIFSWGNSRSYRSRSCFCDSGELGYNVYTFLYGVLNIIFAYGVWAGKKSGWLGTIIVSLLVIVVDICAVLNITLILGVPKTAALGEIVYSLVVVAYLFQPKIIKLFKKVN
jgi:hypothetical protein